MRQIFGLVARARKVGDRLGVLVQCLRRVESSQTIARLHCGTPMRAFSSADQGARTAGKLAEIFGPHAQS